MRVEELLRTEAQAIVDDAAAAVRRAHLAGYERSGVQPTVERLRALLDVTIAAVERRSVEGALAHARSIARERYQAGFDLGEVQTAINVLEEAVWRLVLARLPPAGQAEALGLVSTVLGMTKDTLARSYVELASRQHAPSLDLRALFQGTGSEP